MFRLPLLTRIAVSSVFFGLMPIAAFAADVVLVGTVTDASDGRPVVGATITVDDGGRQIGNARSGSGGTFRVTVTVEDSGLHPFKVITEDAGYRSADMDAEALNGNLQQDAFDFSLLPNDLAPCLFSSSARHPVVVGHFFEPPGDPISDIPGRLSLALQEELDLHLQLARAPSPTIADCDGAQFTGVDDGRGIARALNAHALLYGSVTRQQPHYKVKARIIDAHDSNGPAVRTTSAGVDLANPDEAKMHPKVYVAILSAMAAGALTRNDCAGALSIADAASRLSETAPDFVNEVQQVCELP